MDFVNLTPHAVVVRLADGTDRSFPPSGTIARVATNAIPMDPIDGIPLSRTVFGGTNGIPDPAPNTVFITSSLVATGARRPDVVAPDTGPSAIRENGQVVAVKGFQAFV